MAEGNITIKLTADTTDFDKKIKKALRTVLDTKPLWERLLDLAIVAVMIVALAVCQNYEMFTVLGISILVGEHLRKTL